MSDEITPEYIEDLKRRQPLFADIALGIDLEAEMRDSLVIRTILKAVEVDHNAALDELVEMSPLDAEGISRCLVNVKTFRYIRRALDAVLSRGKRAEAIEASHHAQEQSQSYE